MKSESFLIGFKGQVARFMRVSQGLMEFEKKVSFFETNFQKNYELYREQRVGIDETRFVSAQEVRV